MSGGFFVSPFSFQILIAMRQHKFTLEEHELPTHYYNVVADMHNESFITMDCSQV